MGEDYTELKKEINNLIWMYGKKSLTLEEAEKMACAILEMITNEVLQTHGENNLSQPTHPFV